MAGPFLDVGDVGVRHDLQLLADSGIIRSPVTTWPLSWPDIAREVSRGASLAGQPDSVRFALRRVQIRLDREMDNRGDWHLALSASGKDRSLRTFGDAPRRDEQEQIGIEAMGSYVAIRLQTTTAKDKSDTSAYNETLEDGSYLALRFGNWSLGVDQMDRWWGPGWEGSLILSNNARPVPVVALNRLYSEPFETKWLSWLGPWHFIAFMGELEDARDYSRTKLLGMRLTFKPTANLEIGVSRTAQWGGEGRPQGWQVFQDLLLGKDNSAEITGAEPGNQLAGFDVRWAFPRAHMALYAQGIGEDEAGSFPSHFMKLAGLESWFGSSISSRVYLEFADTKAKLFDVAYNHGIYTDGYRHYGQSLGHALDSDGTLLSLGLVTVLAGGTTWELRARKAELNRDDSGQNPLAPRAENRSMLGLVNRIPLGQNTVSWGVSSERRTAVAMGIAEDFRHAFAHWRLDW